MGGAPVRGRWEKGPRQIGHMADRWRGATTTTREQRSRVAAGLHGSMGQGRPKGNGGSRRAGQYRLAGIGRSERTVTFCNYLKLFKRV
jgi:hypothetical protein